MIINYLDIFPPMQDIDSSIIHSARELEKECKKYSYINIWNSKEAAIEDITNKIFNEFRSYNQSDVIRQVRGNLRAHIQRALGAEYPLNERTVIREFAAMILILHTNGRSGLTLTGAREQSTFGDHPSYSGFLRR